MALLMGKDILEETYGASVISSLAGFRGGFRLDSVKGEGEGGEESQTAAANGPRV